MSQIARLLADRQVMLLRMALAQWQDMAAAVGDNKAYVSRHALKRWHRRAKGLRDEQDVITAAVTAVVEHVLSFAAEWSEWSHILTSCHEMRRLLNLWKKLYQRLENHRFRPFVAPWFEECTLLAENLHPWVEYRLAQATQLTEGDGIQTALTEARQVQQIAMMMATIGEGNYKSVLASWHHNEKVNQGAA